MSWFFHRNAVGSWRWTCVRTEAGRDMESHRGFATKIECIADAKMHGFASNDAAESGSSARSPDHGRDDSGARADQTGGES